MNKYKDNKKFEGLRECICILVHGFNKDKNDMVVLANHLTQLEYKCILVDLPLTFKHIELSTSLLEEKLEQVFEKAKSYKKVNLIGHSTGGLVIRDLLDKTKFIDSIDKCVLIATPNNGSQLADLTTKLPQAFTNIFTTIKCLRTQKVKNLRSINEKEVHIGAIAGNNSNLLLGKLLSNDNDGRVKVSSVKHNSLNDFIVLPYGHKEIHYKILTAELINSFIRTGKFREERLENAKDV